MNKKMCQLCRNDKKCIICKTKIIDIELHSCLNCNHEIHVDYGF